MPPLPLALIGSTLGFLIGFVGSMAHIPLWQTVPLALFVGIALTLHSKKV